MSSSLQPESHFHAYRGNSVAPSGDDDQIFDYYDEADRGILHSQPFISSPSSTVAHCVSQINKLIILKLEREKMRKQGDDCGPSPDWALLLSKFLPLAPTHKYEKVKFIGDGTYSNVYQVRDPASGAIYAMKKIKSPSASTQVSLTTLREMKVLLSCRHPNLINLIEFVVGSRPCSLGYVVEYCEVDLLALIKRLKHPFPIKVRKSFMQQIFMALEYLHGLNIVHRDVKLSNFLLSMDGTLKICDFGLARGLYDENPDLVLTPLVVTLWYRSPELLLGETHYTSSVDIWATGCIFYELVTVKPLFPGKTELDEIDHIFSKLGTPNDKIWPGFSKLPHCQKFAFVNRNPSDWLAVLSDSSSDSERALISSCLSYEPNSRITASKALQHSYFSELPASERFVMTQEFVDSMPEALHST